MKSLATVIFSGLLLAGTAAAQHSFAGSGAAHSGGGHFGISNPGFGAASRGGYRGGYGGSIGGRGGYGGGNGGYGGGRGYGGYRGYRRPAVIVPYAYPVLPSYGLGGYGYGYPDYGYDPGYGYDSGYGYSAPPPAAAMDYGPGGGQPAPPVIINQTFVNGAPVQGPPPGGSPYYTGNGGLPIYQAPAPSPQEAAVTDGRYYLIAYKDHSVYTALAFWMENGALNYVTPQNAHNQVSLDLVDMDLTKKLNGERGLAFNVVNR